MSRSALGVLRTHGAEVLLLVALSVVAPSCSLSTSEGREPLAGIAERTWRGGGEVDLGPTGGALGIVAQGKSYRTKQYAVQFGTERRVIAVSKDRGPIDILFARSPSDGDEVIVYLTAEDGILRRAIHQKGAAGPTEIPNSVAERDFQVQKEFWFRKLSTMAP
jgi:hypothetical protein